MYLFCCARNTTVSHRGVCITAELSLTLFSEQKGTRQSRRRHTGSRDAVPTGSGFRKVMRGSGDDKPGAYRAAVSDQGRCRRAGQRVNLGSGPTDQHCRSDDVQPGRNGRRRVETGSHREPVSDHRTAGLVGRICQQTGHVRRHELRYWRAVSGKIDTSCYAYCD